VGQIQTPLVRGELWLPDGRELTIPVGRAQRLANACYQFKRWLAPRDLDKSHMSSLRSRASEQACAGEAVAAATSRQLLVNFALASPDAVPRDSTAPSQATTIVTSRTKFSIPAPLRSSLVALAGSGAGSDFECDRPARFGHPVSRDMRRTHPVSSATSASIASRVHRNLDRQADAEEGLGPVQDHLDA